ncbi:PIR Superfamily Protein [Plasmodium ovale curtisi]|uniref:PIR Superfamily Protein n=2 Tax=Plasmodium ovale TaxID=36330 RepID=A0A1A8WKF5_PLAOA|nr:PIR Superfamily Protein [Plasmodium ovale curtisi]SBT72945.1 PIR protein [Plasmodium ovale]
MYGFCSNSPYYKMVIENKKKNDTVLTENEKKNVENIENVCKSIQENICSFANSSATDICKDFFYMYKYLHEFYNSRNPENTLTNEDFDFLNYWLNVKLKDGNSNASMCINEFNKIKKNESENFISKKKKLEKDLHVIDPDNLENMELLYELYDNSRNILNMMRGQDYQDDVKTNEERKSCSDYTEDCSTKYKKAMDKCLNDNDDFYKVLKDFKISYNIAVEQETDDLRNCKSIQYFHLPNYDPVLEKQRNIMAGKILSAPLILSFVIPLLYKYTPFGPFFRAKTKMIKNRWMNPEENESELLLSSTDVEDNISDNGEYNIGYYSRRDK